MHHMLVALRSPSFTSFEEGYGFLRCSLGSLEGAPSTLPFDTRMHLIEILHRVSLWLPDQRSQVLGLIGGICPIRRQDAWRSVPEEPSEQSVQLMIDQISSDRPGQEFVQQAKTIAESANMEMAWFLLLQMGAAMEEVQPHDPDDLCNTAHYYAFVEALAYLATSGTNCHPCAAIEEMHSSFLQFRHILETQGLENPFGQNRISDLDTFARCYTDTDGAERTYYDMGVAIVNYALKLSCYFERDALLDLVHFLNSAIDPDPRIHCKNHLQCAIASQFIPQLAAQIFKQDGSIHPEGALAAASHAAALVAAFQEEGCFESGWFDLPLNMLRAAEQQTHEEHLAGKRLAICALLLLVDHKDAQRWHMDALTCALRGSSGFKQVEVAAKLFALVDQEQVRDTLDAMLGDPLWNPGPLLKVGIDQCPPDAIPNLLRSLLPYRSRTATVVLRQHCLSFASLIERLTLPLALTDLPVNQRTKIDCGLEVPHPLNNCSNEVRFQVLCQLLRLLPPDPQIARKFLQVPLDLTDKLFAWSLLYRWLEERRPPANLDGYVPQLEPSLLQTWIVKPVASLVYRAAGVNLFYANPVYPLLEQLIQETEELPWDFLERSLTTDTEFFNGCLLPLEKLLTAKLPRASSDKERVVLETFSQVALSRLP